MPADGQIFCDGKWVAANSPGTIGVESAVTGQVVRWVADGDEMDVDRAVQAARRAQLLWSEVSVSERAALVAALGTYLIERMSPIAEVITEEVGTPISVSRLVQVGLPAYVAMTTAEAAATYPFSEKVATSLVLREPAGVAACITPWNYPLHQAMAKVAPALVAGCTVVVKPSEVAPSGAMVLGEAAQAVGLPPGVVNLLTGGPATGRSLVSHPDIDLVSFTGSSPAGREVAATAAGQMKRIALELGGKSAALVLDDADVEEAVRSVVRQAMLNGGQTCIAWTRLVVPRAAYDDAAALAAEVACGLLVGDPHQEETEVGPLASSGHRRHVQHSIRAAEAGGAKRLCGGAEPPPGLGAGFFVAPTVFGGVEPDMALAREEVFGPVLAVMAHDGDDDATEIANDSAYGLHGAVFSADVDRAQAVARRLRTGRVDVGNAGFNPVAPMGGYKQSGVGRELGRFGIDTYVEIKSIQLP